MKRIMFFLSIILFCSCNDLNVKRAERCLRNTLLSTQHRNIKVVHIDSVFGLDLLSYSSLTLNKSSAKLAKENVELWKDRIEYAKFEKNKEAMDSARIQYNSYKSEYENLKMYLDKSFIDSLKSDNSVFIGWFVLCEGCARNSYYLYEDFSGIMDFEEVSNRVRFNN